MKILFLILSLAICVVTSAQQQQKGENIVILTMDGLRWQELFGGADSLLTFDTSAIYSEKYVQRSFWAPTEEERRKKLMPFLWTEIASKGILLGNQKYGNRFENANPYWFSYPGYNEIFTGFPDTSVNSNDKKPNKNETVLEYLNKLREYKGKVTVFGSWDLFSYIFNEKRSGLSVNDGFRNLEGKLNDKQKLFNQVQHEMPDLFHGGERLDVATFNIAFEYMRANKPKIIFFGLGDTDEFAHAGMYDYYLDAARKTDAWVKKLWEYIQSDPAYANKTTLILTTDHGRGYATNSRWRHHGPEYPESKELWMAAIGPSIPSTGESKKAAHNFQGQIAATIAAILGKTFKPAHTPLPALKLN